MIPFNVPPVTGKELEYIESAIKSHKICGDGIFTKKCTEFLDVVPNPTVDVVNEATEIYKSVEATSIIALGGGSPMDVAKAVGVLANFGGKITDYEGNHKRKRGTNGSN